MFAWGTLVRLAREKIINGHQDTFRSKGYLHYFDCGGDINIENKFYTLFGGCLCVCVYTHLTLCGN